MNKFTFHFRMYDVNQISINAIYDIKLFNNTYLIT